jgi:hypothetical protein
MSIDMNTNGGQIRLIEDMNAMLFTDIFNQFPNLEYLNFGVSAIWYQYVSFPSPFPTLISST